MISMSHANLEKVLIGYSVLMIQNEILKMSPCELDLVELMQMEIWYTHMML